MYRQRHLVASAPASRSTVHVLATTHEGTRCALALAKRLTARLGARIVLLVPTCAPIAECSDPGLIIDEQRAVAAEVGVPVKLLFSVCRRRDDVVRFMLERSSLVIVGGRKRIFWPTAEQRLVTRLTGEGYPVVFAQLGPQIRQPLIANPRPA